MVLENKYYRIVGTEPGETGGIFHIRLIADCDVYRGHFPGNPVCPGVCNIEVVKECVSALTRRNLLLTTIKQCRLTAVASPSVCQELQVRVETVEQDGGFAVTARISDADKIYVDFKGFFSVVPDKKET